MMRVRIRPRSRGGFTLVELMIVVALIGVLASIAIPAFVTYQARSRRAEAFTNLSSLARSYKGYSAESGVFPDMFTESGELQLPDFTTYGLGTAKMPWDNPTQSFFDIVGWQSDGDVFYSYEVNANCVCTLCFTAAAHGDVDGDGLVATLMYVHPQRDANGAVTGECQSYDGFSAPVHNGLAIYDGVGVYVGPTRDDY